MSKNKVDRRVMQEREWDMDNRRFRTPHAWVECRCLNESRVAIEVTPLDEKAKPWDMSLDLQELLDSIEGFWRWLKEPSDSMYWKRSCGDKRAARFIMFKCYCSSDGEKQELRLLFGKSSGKYGATFTVLPGEQGDYPELSRFEELLRSQL